MASKIWLTFYKVLQDALLSQGEPHDAIISFDTTASCMRLLWHSTAFLYRPTSVTVQMLKLHHTVRWFSQLWRKITAHDQNHGEKPRWSLMRDYLTALRNASLQRPLTLVSQFEQPDRYL